MEKYIPRCFKAPESGFFLFGPRGTGKSVFLNTCFPDALVVDLLDPGFWQGDPHPALTWMRANEPVWRDEANGLWGVTRHADVHDVERRSDVFISRAGYRSWGSPEENNMIAQDDPQHLVQRRLVSDRFTPRSVRDHSEWLASTIGELLDGVPGDAPFDVIGGLAAQLPCRLTAMLLGFPEDRWTDIKGWSERLMRIDTAPTDPDVAMGMFTAIGEFGALLNEEAPRREGCPVHEAADLLSVWVNAEQDGQPLYGADRLVHETGLFISGGAETTRTVIAHGLAVLAQHPDQWELMASDPTVVTTAVEELIRWVTPLNNFFRTPESIHRRSINKIDAIINARMNSRDALHFIAAAPHPTSHYPSTQCNNGCI